MKPLAAILLATPLLVAAPPQPPPFDGFTVLIVRPVSLSPGLDLKQYPLGFERLLQHRLASIIRSNWIFDSVLEFDAAAAAPPIDSRTLLLDTTVTGFRLPAPQGSPPDAELEVHVRFHGEAGPDLKGLRVSARYGGARQWDKQGRATATELADRLARKVAETISANRSAAKK